MNTNIDTFGGAKNLFSYSMGKDCAALSINPEQTPSFRLGLRRIELTKKQIRSKILAKLRIQKEEERSRKSRIIKDKLFRTVAFRKAKRVMFYFSFAGEVETREMIREAQKLGKIVAVPVCENGRTIKPCIFKAEAGLKRGPYGISEPAIREQIHLKDLDLIVVPGVAFDKKGNRLGRGKGHYDRFLGKLPRKIPVFALAFDFQILPLVPTTQTDVNVSRVLFA